MTVGRSGTFFASMLAIAFAASLQASLADEWHTTSSLTGPSKYGENFQRYDYVNPDAPKGGAHDSVVVGTFDSFNPYIVSGSPAAGLAGFGGGLLYDTLMDQATDEGSVSHPLVAEAYKYPPDYSSATYRLDRRAKWHDGQPITVDDVVWSFQVLKANAPQYNRYFENVTDAVAISDREVEFHFNQKGNRELPKIIGDLVVLPKHWWEGTDASGKKRDITRPTLEPPLGSAAYKIASFKPGSEIVWQRVADYWGAKLPVKIGRENFDTQRFTYILDENAAWQAFTKGGLDDIKAENSSRRWATAYNFPAVNAGDVIKKEFKTTSPEPMQAFMLNQRRPLFQDRRVREALTYPYDFETMNRTLFFNSNTRTQSYFQGTELASSGLPQGKELEILEKYRDKLPPELFTQEFKLPVYDSPQAERKYLKQAVDLFAQAGWVIKGGKMMNAKSGAPFKFEILGTSDTDQILSGNYIANLRKIGVDATLRIIDPSQYVNRVNNFDYDVITNVLQQSDSPGNEQRDFWSSKSADSPGSRNYSGIKDPVVDALVDRVIFATDRDDLVAATHALDRVLLWNYYTVPQYYRAVVWLAYWNKFGMPEKQPSYRGADIDSWWIDTAKEKALTAKYRGN
ncbi:MULTISPECIES: extracellular solute-binding protein [unclassified Mesorhizobium]|uniref:extracellular solute-binding protein n=4 Tax=Mesorhizobium TaxID=68287 RepID=UPI000FCB30D6|nr:MULTISPECIES: extracellular solute-binding protein [unclassified Mesorhizobium]RUV41994.1 ABC transporter substrate-binding protein [Mesorhizobium sp. M1A.T.Ca.IN.004.03.1.1]RWK87398.1 MAG: ABC transporter substrate-binding protein [Mesorhizobium sp.]TIP19715.1 MAG: ABC transporter substrate-binding protein [Mesorhizobium sp.]TJV81726.1 MAG: ABC transporter substrate-binding protein [Mesorhizobium sp.]TJW21615.1 MAG: ABC transporter substrate-binding protein [Mesorhizobium sp.]